MGSEQRWRWAGIVSVIGIVGVLISDIVGNVVGGYITDRLKNWRIPEPATAGTLVASVQGSAAPAPKTEEQAGPQLSTPASDEHEPASETMAAHEPMPLPEADPEAMPDREPPSAPPPERPVVSGSVERVIDTATLKIGGETVLLAGVEGLGSPYRDQLAKFIEEQGSEVRCLPNGVRHTCYVSEVDLALAALTNGAARLASDAPDKYREAVDEARRNGRGIFR
jgi:endonuclease YncB( thermonuclease family)